MKNIKDRIYVTIRKVNGGCNECHKPIIIPQYPIGNKKCSKEINEVLKTDGQKNDKNSSENQNNCWYNAHCNVAML